MNTRRDFIKLMAVSSGALVFGIRGSFGSEEDVSSEFRPSAWLRIEPDGSIVIQVGKTEMGQGVRTSLPMILAEELDADFARVRIEQASPGTDFQRLGTGGSGSIMGLWDPLRQAGATARVMLVAAAAAKWGVSPESCQTVKSVVIHQGTDRRISYGELTAEAGKQPIPESPSLKGRSEYRLLGTPQKRIDGPDIVTGRARYGLDVRVPGMLRAVVARSPVLGGGVDSFDAEKALEVRGVTRVVQIPTGIAVIADNTWSAMEGRDALEIVWAASPHAEFDSREHMGLLEKATIEPGITIRKDGEGRSAMTAVPRKIESLYLYPFAAHASVEPVNCTAFVTDDRCEIWSPTQTPNAVHQAAAEILGMAPENVTVNVTLLGGGFGRRLGVDFDREAVEVAKRLPGTPVQLVWSREDDIQHGYFQAASAHRLIAGVDESGRVVAWEHRKASTPHQARRVPTEENYQDPQWVQGSAWGVYDSPYAVRDAEMTYAVVKAPVPIGPWRAVFAPSSVFARECFIDEIAVNTKRDPLELRVEMLGANDETVAPVFEIRGDRMDRRRMRKVFEVAADKAGWNRPVEKGRGRGIAGDVFHTETYVAYVVEVSRRDESAEGQLPFVVDRVVCAIDCGVPINPDGIAQQVESGVIWSLSNMKSEMTWKNGVAQQSSYFDHPVVMMDESPTVIETHIVDSGDPNPHGIGEPTVCPFAPAVANALSRLVGKRVRNLPVRVQDIG